MENAKEGLESQSRNVTDEEAELVRWLVEHGEPGCDRLLSQVKDLKVVSKCKCGCPTVYFALEGEGNSRKGERLVSDWLAKMNEELFGVMLFEVAGEISSLEVYSCAGTVKSFDLPETSMLLGYDERSVDQLVPPPS